MPIDLANAPTVKPTPTGVTAELAPLIAEGVKLVKCVLLLTACSILLLVLVFTVFEAIARKKAVDVYNRAAAEALAVRPANDHDNINLFIAELRRANSDTSWTMSPAEATDAATAVKEITTLYLPNESQKADLAVCLPLRPSTDVQRVPALTRCLNTVIALVPVTNDTAVRVKLLQDIQKQQDDASQAFRSFWMQVCQLILMNIFFPLLTALLGYIFGTSSKT